jgi:AcrR family transcriptional regulator
MTERKIRRLKPEARSREILTAALALAENVGLQNMKRNTVAEKSKAANGSINHYFGDMDGLRTAVVEFAIEEENLAVLAEAIATRHPAIESIPPKLRARVLRAL